MIFVGDDWAEAHHDICIIDEAGRKLAKRRVPEGLDGVRVYAPDGTALGHIHLPERCANVCFGGRHRNRLFMAASHSVYALYVNTQGA